MVIEVVLKAEPKIEIEGYEKIKVPVGVVFANPVNKRVELVVKQHPDGRVSVFTDNSEVVKSVAESGDVVDIHAK